MNEEDRIFLEEMEALLRQVDAGDQDREQCGQCGCPVDGYHRCEAFQDGTED